MPTAGDLFYFASKQGAATKPAVVLIHGAGGDHLHWPYNVRRMGDYRVFAPDLPGHGKSEGIGEQTIGGYAKIVASWLIAFIEYTLAVPANRIGHRVYSAAELKTIQKVISLTIFLGFSALWLKEPVTMNHVIGFGFIVVGAGIVFRGPF